MVFVVNVEGRELIESVVTDTLRQIDASVANSGSNRGALSRALVPWHVLRAGHVKR